METIAEKKTVKNKLVISGKTDGFNFQYFNNEGQKISLSAGNKKLPYNTLIFNILSELTCPFKTSFCASKCYAKKAERLYPSVRASRKNNLKRSQNVNFKDDVFSMVSAINEKMPNLITHFRIHESGDFYSQAYFDQWQSIARLFPKIQFYAYTKSFFLNFEKKADNMILIASFDHSSTEHQKTLYEKNSQYFNKEFHIVEKTAEASCIQDCTKCNLCFTPSSSKQKITVNLH